ncbi:MAG TPA: NADH-ubiquinone oxidoreductase-F iron-sulfur binding region domain-containing protein [Stellaceae bacterium]|nr:NADH-ubiquinone oxidoreductase-F iron-sulfur binding region domain-containing protein [Stellaceae bacterium]
MTRPRIFVPRDAGALALGSDEVERAIVAAERRRGLDIEIVRIGSRGLFWLEPMIEVETAQGRIAYGPVKPADVEPLFAAGWLDGGPHPLRLGRPEDVPFLARQTRFTFARCGIVDRLSLADYRAHRGTRGLEKAVALGPRGIVEEVTNSGLRGRGGAGFPTGIKWRTTAEATAAQKYIVCNADEGDSGTYADRMIMEGDPFALIEGMAIAGIAVGATRGFIYIRSEYPHAVETFGRAVAIARAESLLGTGIAGSAHDFDIDIRVGAGAYICGEETALLDSLEGKRGQVRAKPPLPAHHGAFGRPTVVNNVISLATVPAILADGADAYRDLGYGRSRGTMPIQLAGNVKYRGLFEAGFGLSLGEIVDDIGGGTATGRPVRAVQVGGPLGAYFPRALFDTPFDYEAFAAKQGLVGHGGVVVFDDTVDMARQARFAMEFCAIESCGKCTPCRIGSVRGVEVVDRIIAGERVPENLALLEELCETLRFGSLCALGGFVPFPVISALTHFPEDFGGARKAVAA